MNNKFMKGVSIIALALTLGVGTVGAMAQTVTGSNALAYFGINSLATVSGAALVSGDLVPVYQLATDTVKAVSATGLASKATSINGNTITAGTGTLTLQGTAVVTGPATTDTLAGLGSSQTFTGTDTFGAGSSIVSKTSTSSTDINPPFDNRILGNPIVKVAHGSCTVAAVNADTCVILAGVASRTITVSHFDIIATGSAATCTGVLLEDNNGTPVVVATLAAATLTNGAHNVPLAATLGVGYGAASGLTVAKGLQLDVNGSGCTTTTAFLYNITYTVQ